MKMADHEKKQGSKPDDFYAKVAFYLSLGFWIPLFNIGLCISSIVIAVFVLRKMFREPGKHGGFGYAVAAIVLSITSLILTVIGIVIYLLSPNICATAFCQTAGLQ